MKTYQISGELLQDIADYLQQRPYREVVGLLNRMQDEAENQPQPQPESKAEEGEGNGE